jgi:hypothetical protein
MYVRFGKVHVYTFRMHAFFLALWHLLWKSLTKVVGGWMSTTLLALAVGVINYYVEPKVDAWIHHTTPRKRPKLTGAIIVTVGCWLVLFGANVIYTIYADHAMLVQENQSFAGKQISADGEIKILSEENAQLKAQLKSFSANESPDSLRRRTEKLADEYYKYALKRREDHPPAAYPDSRDPNPTEERKKMIAACRKYDQETEDYYQKHFKDRMVGIVKEYNAHGVKTGYLESDLTQRPPSVAVPGSAWEGSLMDGLSQFPELAYHVDKRDRLIVLAD